MGILNVLPLLGGDHWRDLTGLEVLQSLQLLSLSAPLTLPLVLRGIIQTSLQVWRKWNSCLCIMPSVLRLVREL